MKKKLLFVVLAVMVAVLFVFVSCGNEETSSSTPAETSAPATSAPETSAPATSAPETSAPATSEPATSEPATSEPATSEPATSEPATSEPVDEGPWTSQKDVKKTWDGQTLNVLAARYGGTAAGPWTQVELNPAVWGETMVTAEADREAKVLELYGVTLNFAESTHNQRVSRSLTPAMASETDHYEVTFARSFDVQELMEGNLLFDLANREYIDLDNDYYSDESIRVFTVAGHTMLLDGDFNFMNEETSYFLLFNKNMLKNAVNMDADAIYDEVMNGTWTYDKFVTIARNVTKDVNGNGEWDDGDIYGFGSKNFQRLYRHFGTYGVYVNETTGLYEFALNKNATRLNTTIESIIGLKTASWANDSWGGDWGAGLDQGFAQGRCLFYTDVCEKINEIAGNAVNYGMYFSMGVLPFPKLEASDTRYYTPLTGGAQNIFIAVPKATANRDMSDYFVDVLSWTGRDYIMNAYIQHKMSAFDMESADKDLKIMKEFIWDHIIINVANGCYGWGDMLSGLEGAAISDNTNNFAQAWTEKRDTIQENINGFNALFQNYSDTYEAPAEE